MALFKKLRPEPDTLQAQRHLRLKHAAGNFPAFLLALLLAVLIQGAAFAQVGTVISFDNIGGDQVAITEQYAALGVHFTSATTLTSGSSLNPVYIPHSGAQLVYDFPTGIITATFDKGQSIVGGFITGNRAILMSAFDAQGKLLASKSTPGPNYTGAGTGIPPNYKLELTSPQGNIVKVTFHDGGNTFTLDDFYFAGGGITIDPTLPAAVRPSFRPRSGYNILTAVAPQTKKISVKDTAGNPIANAKIRLTLTGNNVPGGHLAGHTPGSVHGWLFGQNDSQVDDDGVAINAATAVASDASGGSVANPVVNLTTDQNGEAIFVYIPSEVSGVDTLKAESADGNGLTPATKAVSVKIDGLVALQYPAQAYNGVPLYYLYGSGDATHFRFGCTGPTLTRIINAAQTFVAMQQTDPELLGYLTQLQAQGVTVPIEGIYVNDLSLPWGGLFDIVNNFTTPHGGHRDGTNADIRTTHLVNSSNTSLAGGAAYLQALGASDLEKHARYRQYQLLYGAIKPFAIRNGILQQEGDSTTHFHVSFPR